MEQRQQNNPLERPIEGGGAASVLTNVQLREEGDNLDDDAGFQFGSNNIGGGGLPQGVDTNRF